MLIGIEKRFVLISNSKAGSTSLEHAFSGYAEIGLRSTKMGKHSPWMEIRRRFHFLFDHPDYSPETFFRFGVIRDPVDRFVSWYNYRFEPAWRRHQQQPISIEEFWGLDDWVKFDRDGRKKLQRDVFSDDDGLCRFDLVLPLSMLGEYEQKLGDRLGIKLQIPSMNASRKLISTKDLPTSFVNEVRDFYKDDYEFLDEWQSKAPAALTTSTKAQTKRFKSFHTPRQENVQLDLAWVVRKPLPKNIAFLKIESGKSAAIAGIAVKSETADEQSSLAVRQDGQLSSLVWGLSSPGLVKRFAGNPHAAVARFRLAGGRTTLCPGAELVLVSANDASEVLAVLEKSS